jgi:hypothetical protein
MTTSSEAASTRKTASARVVEVCHQTIDRTSPHRADELSCIVADLAVLARAISAMAENPVAVGARDGDLIPGFDQRQVSDVLRLATWIDDIAERALADFEAGFDQTQKQ